MIPPQFEGTPIAGVVTDETSSGRILLAEDSAVVRAMVRHVLESANYTVTEAANGQEAYELCKQNRPEVAILNIEMPILDGRQLLKLLKATPEFADIPVIFLTGRTSTTEIVEGLRLGAHDYLRKPFEAPELIARVSAAIRVARLQQQLSDKNIELNMLSRTDLLTGLANRRHGEERLKAEIENSARYHRPLTLLMLDIDHFKVVNDRFGHAGGDVVLKNVALRLHNLLRAGDVAARWGGEEFLVILPDAELDGGVALGQRFLRVMREEPVALDDQHSCAVTVSIGATARSDRNSDHLLREADDALYRAKREGRDRLCLPA